MQILKRFNVRVYGLLIDEHNRLLVADEAFANGHRATKFPGGGVELGEGTIEALKREFIEETGVKVEVLSHFYTTDFFQYSYFDNESQIVSIYYICSSNETDKIRISTRKFNFEVVSGKEAESFRWVNIADLDKETDINLPIDQVVIKKLMKEYRPAP